MTHKDTILIADDDAGLNQILSVVLREEGFDVLTAKDGIECLRTAYAKHPDLVLLDIDMPNKDGREVCRQLREASNVPIIMLSVFNTEKEKVERFHDGADDYVTKPFSNTELVARIRTVLRRAHLTDPTRLIYNDGHLFIDFDARVAQIGDKPILLTPIEWKLMDCLIKNANRVVPRKTLLRQVWGDRYENEFTSLKVFIVHLRRKLQDPARRPRYIHTERDMGYRFETHN